MLKKIIVILSLFLLLINIFVVTSLGFDFDYSDKSYSLPDDFYNLGDNILIFYNYVSAYPSNSSTIIIIGNEFYCNSGYSGFTCPEGQLAYYYEVGGTDYNSALKTMSSLSVSDFSSSPSVSWSAVDYKNRSRLIYANFDFNTESGKTVFAANAKPKFNAPFFMTSENELASGKFDTLKIDAGDLDFANDKFILNIYNGINVSDTTYDYTLSKSFLLDSSCSYLYVSNLNLYYYIPQSKLGIDFSNDKHYMFELKEYGNDEVYSSVSFTVGGLTTDEEIKNAQDVTNDKLDEQTEAIKNQTETNKGIWETIKDILSYINPFSENFFVYKLLELLGDMLKALFVPSEEFMSQWFTDISDYFEDAFGILYYPIDLVIQVLGRFSNIAEQEPVISFGNFSLFGGVLIPAYSFNFNSLLTNNVLKTMHDFYLIVIDVILWFGLLVYCKNVVANIFGGKFTDDVIDDIQDNDYARYSNYQANKQRYKEEHGGGKR